MSIIRVMVEVKIEAVRVSLMTTTQVVILKDVNEDRFLPIFIAKPEGDSITVHLRDDAPGRPMSHDLALQIAQFLDAQLVRIQIVALRDKHYFAEIVIESDGQEIVLDSRASDAIALAVRAQCPMYVSEDIMVEVGVAPNDEGNESTAAGGDQFGAFGDFLDSLNLDLDNDK
jgi:uncharacterized protein